MEIGGTSQRVMAGIIFSYAVYVGEIVFAILAMTLQYWKWLILTIYAPMILFISYFFLLKESPRWQILQGRMEEAKSTLKIIARMNKIDIADKDLDGCTDEELRSRFDVGDQKQKENLKAIISSKEIMTRLVVAAFCFFASSFLYYGSLVHSVLLPGSKYTNFILAAASSFPGEIIAYFTFNKYGRKITLQCGYVVCAVFLIAQSYTPNCTYYFFEFVKRFVKKNYYSFSFLWVLQKSIKATNSAGQQCAGKKIYTKNFFLRRSLYLAGKYKRLLMVMMIC